MFDCGSPRETKIIKVMTDNLPLCAREVISSIKMTEEDMIFLSTLLELEVNYVYTARETAEIWLRQNKAKWKRWMKDVSCQAKKSDFSDGIQVL
ncbi:hypothetical protein CS022_05835 [Veronia nyctiphanis]|uniref:Uncharacterized protein n=1 Tax=Veronia nyctiphanis TaxID=1278244 RepID=A0A4Q0YSK0_9GAMM|nr:hypothetical protein [Veronia nyctiphanis]RXJ74136.1 hypothetical protein CS022_05835 [Veronia nyctiphanis]